MPLRNASTLASLRFVFSSAIAYAPSVGWHLQ